MGMKENDQAVNVRGLDWVYHWFLFPAGLVVLGAFFSTAALTEQKESEDSESGAHCLHGYNPAPSG